jgi:hypothetical protein
MGVDDSDGDKFKITHHGTDVGGADHFTMDASGNVGIGTNAPIAKLNIYTADSGVSPSTSADELVIENSSIAGMTIASPTSGHIFFGDSSDAAVGQISYTHSSNHMTFATGGTARMTIDSAGRVTMPYQPAFKAGRSAPDVSYSTNQPIIFNDTSGNHFNNGGHYSTSTGKFTAPVAGIYFFYALVIYMSVSDGSNMADQFYFYKNGTRVSYSSRRAEYVAGTTGNGGYYTDWGTVSVELAVNDTLWVETNPGTIHSNTTYSYFTGHLIG